jgi:spore germination cell wall hydrolase CwlJ-like protein
MKLFRKIFIVTLCFLLISPATAAYAAKYKVTSKDTLHSVSELFDTSVKALRYSNNFAENSFSSGDAIYVPAHVYKVKSGDSLYTIAKKYKVPVADIKKANNKKSNSIKPGQKLILPGVKPNKKTDAVISYSGTEVDLLAKLIEAEASGESMQAKIAVGAVVINRVQSKDWAPSISKVIHQKFGAYYQFTPVKIGTIKNTPSSASKKAAWIAMYGSDPSNGATFYFDTSSKNKWLWSKPQTASLDSMVFAK